VLKTVRSVADLDATIVTELHRIPRQIDAVIGIPRSGMLAASLIALHLQKPLGDVEGICANQVHRRSVRLIGARRLLLVDDTVLKGRAMAAAVAQIRQARPDVQIIRLAVYDAGHTPPGSVDIALATCPCPRAFAWNMWRHKRLPRWMFDLDGVFCRDPTGKENDDGPAYRRFMAVVEPRFLPQRPIGWIVTGRLEKYRADTEAWLRRHHIHAQALYMLDLPSKAARMEHGGRAAFKAHWYSQLPAELFIESDPGQAQKIARLSRKPVWCTDSQTFIPPVALEASA
jgi:uncharacterized HAD superfamily protein/pyrimidine operon attenuation protein/uracil phosphoribosyltransferase